MYERLYISRKKEIEDGIENLLRKMRVYREKTTAPVAAKLKKRRTNKIQGACIIYITPKCMYVSQRA